MADEQTPTDTHQNIDEDEDFRNPDFYSIKSLFYRIVSKKLLVYIIATILFCCGLITSDQWYIIALGYMGGQHIHDLLINWKHGPNASA